MWRVDQLVVMTPEKALTRSQAPATGTTRNALATATFKQHARQAGSTYRAAPSEQLAGDGPNSTTPWHHRALGILRRLAWAHALRIHGTRPSSTLPASWRRALTGELPSGYRCCGWDHLKGPSVRTYVRPKPTLHFEGKVKPLVI